MSLPHALPPIPRAARRRRGPLVYWWLAASLILSTSGCDLFADPMTAPPGASIGEPAPGFSLRDQTGELRELSEFTRSGKVAVIFYRSADW